MSVGVVSLVVVFAVLCLTVFAVLSYATSLSELRLAEKGAQAVEDYYEADLDCSEKAAEWKTLYEEGATEEELAAAAEGGGALAYYRGETLCLEYSSPVDQAQELKITLAFREGRMEVLAWVLVSTGSWEAEDSMVVWDGE
ncbi:MAG: hypothetical protein Q4C22_00625 [Bacillota bacterium]|nr:hypothetical protein [Bacillota bacterium]